MQLEIIMTSNNHAKQGVKQNKSKHPTKMQQNYVCLHQWNQKKSPRNQVPQEHLTTGACPTGLATLQVYILSSIASLFVIGIGICLQWRIRMQRQWRGLSESLLKLIIAIRGSTRVYELSPNLKGSQKKGIDF